MAPPHVRYVVSPLGRARFWVAVMMMGFPALFVLAWWLDPPEGPNPDVSPSVARFGLGVFIAMLVVSFVGGLYNSLFVRVVTIDAAIKQVRRTTTLMGRELHCRSWSMSDFVSIAIRHHSSGDSPGDNFQTDIGLARRSGQVIWLRAFSTTGPEPAQEALRFAVELEGHVRKLEVRRVA